jgi:arylsulfatase A-like enzyme
MLLLHYIKFSFTVSLTVILFFSGKPVHKPVRAKSLLPNIIIILVDDAGYADFGFMGCKDLQTPSLDKLALQAIKFTDAHVTASVCSPSRAGLLTGKYQQRFGYECNEGDGYPGLDTGQLLLPRILKEQGYATAAFGKWHLGYETSQHPLKRGFQYYYGFLSGGRSYFFQPDKDDRKGSKNALLENYQPVSFAGYLTDVLAQKAVAYIRDNKNNPFFMYWAPNAVHTPMEASKEDLEKFTNHPRKKLAAMTFALDRAIGSLIYELKQQGLFENTLIFFLSDNGGAHNNQSSNFPLKGFKGNKFEAGHRVPFLFSWPKHFRGNREFKGLTSSLDIFATTLEAAGVKNISSYKLDGVSLLQYLKKMEKVNPHSSLVWRKDNAAAIRSGDFKMINVEGAGVRLYNLRKDPGETNDLASQLSSVNSKMRKELKLWENDKMKPIWTEGASWDTITLMIHDDLMNNRKVRVRNPEELSEFRSKK